MFGLLTGASPSEVSKTIVAGVHLDLLLESPVEASPELASHWKLEDPSALFTSVLQVRLGSSPELWHLQDVRTAVC